MTTGGRHPAGGYEVLPTSIRSGILKVARDLSQRTRHEPRQKDAIALAVPPRQPQPVQKHHDVRLNFMHISLHPRRPRRSADCRSRRQRSQCR